MKNLLISRHIYKSVALIFALPLLVLCGCTEEDAPEKPIDKEQETSKIEAPVLKSRLTAFDTDGFTLRPCFDNGGDVKENMSCIAHWGAYSKKQTPPPTIDELPNHEGMRIYSDLQTSTYFDLSHAGFNGGTYIYYCYSCSNSKYTTTTDVSFNIVKR